MSAEQQGIHRVCRGEHDDAVPIDEQLRQLVAQLFLSLKSRLASGSSEQDQVSILDEGTRERRPLLLPAR